MREFQITGWPVLPFILIVLLGIIDVIERMLEAIF
jgi:hypothetical protein